MSKRNRHIGRIFRTLLLGAALVCMAGQASAQQGFIERLLGKKTATSGEPADSTETAKERKPLESYFFDDDSLRNRLLFSWTTRPGFNQIDSLVIDTMLNRFYVDYPFQHNDVGSAYLGNLGGAAQRLNYFARPTRQDMTVLNAYDDYLTTPERAPYFNVKRPFTNLTYYMSGNSTNYEQHLRVTHAQNISPSTGINLHYLNRSTRGQYSSQWSQDKNLSLAFSHTGKKYSIHAGYLYNMGDITENGGIVWDNDLLDENENDLPENIDVRLQSSSATNEFKNNVFYINQAYGIPLQRVSDIDMSIADKSSIFIGHALEYSVVNRKYTDDYTNSLFKRGDPQRPDYEQEEAASYYDHWYFNPSQTADSLRERKFDNKLYIQIQPWNRDGIIGTIDAGIGYSMYRYYQFTPQEYIHKNKGVSKNDAYIYGGVHGKLRRYIDWSGNVEYHLSGMRSQDLKIGGQLMMSAFIRNHPIRLTVSASIDNRSPGYWMENFESNHYIWNDQKRGGALNKEVDTRLEAKLEIPSLGLEAGVWQSVTKDKLYYGYGPDTKTTWTSETVNGTTTWTDTTTDIYSVMPKQHSGTLSVTGIYLMKNFKAGIFRFDHRILVQNSSNEEILSVPSVSAYAAYYLDFSLVQDVLHLQVGLSGFYNTKYYASGYNPAIMQFHNQNFERNEDGAYADAPKKIGDYPYLDFFVAAKWKRMRILAKMQHINQDMFGSKPYFGALHYPLNPRMFRLGFSWSFYD